jgi:hypothetical protein
MPALFVRSIAKYLPQEFVVGQSIKVVVGDKEDQIWSGVKRKKEENTESRGEPLIVTCDLSNKKEIIRVNGSVFDGNITLGSSNTGKSVHKGFMTAFQSMVP